jgi:hypothetical protein
MDTVERYRQCIENVMRGYKDFRTSRKDVESVLIIDGERSHFLLLYMGWDGPRRVHHVAVHVELRGDKIWLQCDNTDLVVAEDLAAAGIPKGSIVLGFRAPEVRQYTEYGVG